MRLWSLHPSYLDAKGLVALWREGLLAKKVLENKTKGYRNHPQLDRFKKSQKKLGYINLYLHHVCDEADRRGYTFDRSKLSRRRTLSSRIPVTSGQLDYEWRHLLEKLKLRSPADYNRNRKSTRRTVHPIFRRTRGGIEPWEVVENKSGKGHSPR